MSVPIYKKIDLFDSTSSHIQDKLKVCDFNAVPYMIDSSHVEDKEELIINLELYFEQIDQESPYTHYLIDPKRLHIDCLVHRPNTSSVPQFFNQRTGQLNTKENQINQRIRLKQEQLSSYSPKSFHDAIRRYGHRQKLIHQSDMYIDFLEGILKKLGKKI